MIIVRSIAPRFEEVCGMIFSKSFGYGIRSILYLACVHEERPKVQLEEIATELKMPRFFVAKILNRLVKEGVIASVKGNKGGFSMNKKTLSTRLSVIAAVTNDDVQPGQCVLHLGACNENHPCPLHHEVQPLKKEWDALLMSKTIKDLMRKEGMDVLKSIL